MVVQAGAAGRVLEGEQPHVVHEARRCWHRRARGASSRSADRSPALDELTGRELDVLCLLSRGLTNAEIAAELVVEASRVKSHVASLLSKLGLRDRVQAVVFAYESGLVRAGARA